MSSESYKLYEVEKDVVCLKCGHKGAVQSYVNIILME
jgi:hypothetical protein